MTHFLLWILLQWKKRTTHFFIQTTQFLVFWQPQSVIKTISRIAVSVCVGVQDSGRVAAACYLRRLSTERKTTEITIEIFNFKRPLQAHDLPSCRVTAFLSEIFDLLIIGFYSLHICNSYRPKRLTDLLKFLYLYNGSSYT